MPATPRAEFDAEVRAAIEDGGFEIEDVVHAGSPRACERLGMHESMQCRRCGAVISIVYVTSHGPMGGDCLATLTGDASSRARLRSLSTKLHGFCRDHHNSAVFRLRALLSPHEVDKGKLAIDRVYPSGHERCVHVYSGPRAEVVMVIERLADALGYAPAVYEEANDTLLINARHTWVGREASPPGRG